MEQEIWKPIECFGIISGKYEASNFGNIRVLHTRNTWRLKKEGGILTPSLVFGYPRISVKMEDGSRKNMLVHRIIAATFLKLTEERNIVNHKDGNRENNKIENLEWCTQKQNIQHSWATHLSKKRVGAKNFHSKPVMAISEDGTSVITFPSAKKTKELGFHPSHLASAARKEGKYKRGVHRGFYWSFI